MNAEDHRLKHETHGAYVEEELEKELKRFLSYKRMRNVR